MRYILSIDQGTSSSRAILFDEHLKEVAKSQKEITQFFPQSGWVEHDAEEIWKTQMATCREVVSQSKINPSDIAAIGITNQRETVVVWDKKTGKPLHRAIVWQDRRTDTICDDLKANGFEKHIRSTTGLVIDAYFSATKIKWILDHIPGARENAAEGNILCGTIDTWLIWKMTNGKVHATDHSNASRTMLYDIRNLKWDSTLLNALNIPISILPQIKNSADQFGTTHLFGNEIPICGVAGDQQAALFGHRCIEKGTVKNTYGTGCFMLMQIGDTFIESKANLITTIAWGIENKICYALEGSVFIAGAVIQWLRDQLNIIETADETEAMAAVLNDNEGVYFVPAFTGLGAPHWDMHARGMITGLTRGTNKNHIVRAALESIVYQTRNVLEAMQRDTGIAINSLQADGGASKNNWLMQFQADILQTSVYRPRYLERSALGAAAFAGIGAGIFSIDTYISGKDGLTEFAPKMGSAQANAFYSKWNQAVDAVKMLH